MSSQAVMAKAPTREPLVGAPKDNVLGFVGDVLRFSGEVSFKSMLRIDGNFSGRVNSSQGKLVVTKEARVTDAVIDVASVTINGTVDGDIRASHELILGRTARVRGHLTARDLIIEEGACFDGRCEKI